MSDSTIPQRPPLPANWDGPSKFTLTMQSILRQYVDNYDYFVKSLPLNYLRVNDHDMYFCVMIILIIKNKNIDLCRKTSAFDNLASNL